MIVPLPLTVSDAPVPTTIAAAALVPDVIAENASPAETAAVTNAVVAKVVLLVPPACVVAVLEPRATGLANVGVPLKFGAPVRVTTEMMGTVTVPVKVGLTVMATVPPVPDWAVIAVPPLMEIDGVVMLVVLVIVAGTIVPKVCVPVHVLA